MTWYAIRNDLRGGWAVADRQAPVSGLDTRPIDPDTAQPWPKRDRVICDGCWSQADARRIAAGLNWLENARNGFTIKEMIHIFSEPWPGAEVES